MDATPSGRDARQQGGGPVTGGGPAAAAGAAPRRVGAPGGPQHTVLLLLRWPRHMFYSTCWQAIRRRPGACWPLLPSCCSTAPSPRHQLATWRRV